MAQFDQLILLYNQLINMADDVRKLIERELFDDVMNKFYQHDKIVVQIKLAKKTAKLSEEESHEITRLENELKEKEKANIELMQNNMSFVRNELTKIQAKTKINRAYGQEIINQEQGNIIDIEDSYRQ